tara:strand:+ start:296 stop:475 length:180 start_codon:yes stop_codon:yes gene_type:complete
LLTITSLRFYARNASSEAPTLTGIKGDEGFYRKNQEAQWQKSDFFAWVIKAECTAFEKK